MRKTYLKTDRLKAAKFRGQKALVVEALKAFSTPKSIEEIETKVNENGRYARLLNDWAKNKAGGVHGSVLYHLRALEKIGMVRVQRELKTEFARWGNSPALRISSTILKEAGLKEGQPLDIQVCEGCISIRAAEPRLSLAELVNAITPENRHSETDWGPRVGNEIL